MKKIKDYSPLDDATLVVRLSDVQIKKTTTNVDYASMVAFDGNDMIEAKIWNFSDELRDKLENGEVYVATGRMKDYQGKMQFNINDIRKVTKEDDIDLSEFYEYARIDVEELQNIIENYISKIDNNILRETTVKLLKKHYVNYFFYPAAVNMHHNYYSGLAYHVYSMLTLSDTYLKLYPFINRSLVYSGIILHDLGKLVELSGPKGTEYTKEGKLLGHITIGVNELYNVASSMGYSESEEITNLAHIILSHHGQMEYGSPKEPQTPEAALIHFLDHSDSKLAAIEKEIKKINKGEYTTPVFAFDRRIFYLPNLD
ncbi:MAG: HD domain-containing protein [Bacilli bacterium]|jgi:3'-5' exoribonuclease